MQTQTIPKENFLVKSPAYLRAGIVNSSILRWLRSVALGVGIAGTFPSEAVIFYATDDAAFNTTAPGGGLAGSGWELEGKWLGFLGTPIAPSYFITAKHLGGSVGDSFSLGDVTYITTAKFDDPDSDLRIWRVCGAFSAFAVLYTSRDEVGNNLVVFGRGTQRGAAVNGPALLGQELKGWQWATYDGLKRWGENKVDSVVNGNGNPLFGGAVSGVGEVLKATFDASGGPNEAHLSNGDSGGGVFIKDGPNWKLAGINYGVDGPYNFTSSGAGFDASLFDQGGLYHGGEGKWALTPDLPINQPGAFYATRISSHVDWINSVISQPAGGDTTPSLLVADAVSGPYAAHPAAVITAVDRTVVVPLPDRNQFYRMVACQSLRIASIVIQGDKLSFNYSP